MVKFSGDIREIFQNLQQQPILRFNIHLFLLDFPTFEIHRSHFLRRRSARYRHGFAPCHPEGPGSSQPGGNRFIVAGRVDGKKDI